MHLSNTFLSHVTAIEDPRVDNHNRRHELIDILVIAILGCIGGANGWNELCEFAEAKIDWLKTFLSLPNGVPSHDTCARVFSLIEPSAFESSLTSWLSPLSVDVAGEVIALDGKTLRGSHDKKKNQKALHRVSA